MIDLILNNPFRILGVYSNASKKDIVANEGKMKAFLKVGRSVSFPLDLEGILPSVSRTTESVAKANADLTLPKDKMRYALFWFVRSSNLDDIAFNQLTVGDIEKAIEIWEKKNCATSYQNRLVCYLINDNLPKALEMLDCLYNPNIASISSTRGKGNAFLLLFSAEWCGPSKRFKKEINEAGINSYTLIDVEQDEELAEKYSIRSVPTTLLINEDGTIIKKWVGYDDEDPGQQKFASFIRICGYNIKPYKGTLSTSSSSPSCKTPLSSNANCSELVKLVIGDDISVETSEQGLQILTELGSHYGISTVLSNMPEGELKKLLAENNSKGVVQSINEKIEHAKASKGKGVTARLNAGTELMNGTKEDLRLLKSMLSSTDFQYQMIADKLGLEILQCGIDYYNGSEAKDAAQKAMRLQAYALSIVVGKMANDRCKENVDILEKIIDNLPPAEVFDEDKAIKEELKKFCNLPNKICHSVALLNNTKPYLQSIKAKLGANNIFYLKLSTSIVGNALHNVIEEVNALQNDPTFKLNMILDKAQALDSLKSVLRSAWNATTIMDTFDMEADFKGNRYLENRRTLSNMCNQVGVSIRVSSPRPSPTTSRRPTSPSSQQTITTNSNDSDKMPGCVAYWIGVLVIGIIGACVNGGDGFFVGCIFGLFTGGPFAKLILSDD